MIQVFPVICTANTRTGSSSFSVGGEIKYVKILKAAGDITIKLGGRPPVTNLKQFGELRLKNNIPDKSVVEIMSTLTETVTIAFSDGDEIGSLVGADMTVNVAVPNPITVAGLYPVDEVTFINHNNFYPVPIAMVKEDNAGGYTVFPPTTSNTRDMNVGFEQNQLFSHDLAPAGVATDVIIQGPTAGTYYELVPTVCLEVSDFAHIGMPAGSTLAITGTSIFGFLSPVPLAVVKNDGTAVTGGVIVANGIYYVCTAGIKSLTFTYTTVNPGDPHVAVWVTKMFGPMPFKIF